MDINDRFRRIEPVAGGARMRRRFGNVLYFVTQGAGLASPVAMNRIYLLIYSNTLVPT
jgi:hypothetical protein